jgi:hypothetical protein
MGIGLLVSRSTMIPAADCKERRIFYHFVQDSPCKLSYGKVRYRPLRNPIENEVKAR